MRLIEVGVTPRLIFKNESKPKMDLSVYLQKYPVYSFSKGFFLYESEKWFSFCIMSHMYEKISQVLYKNKNVNKEYHQLIHQRIIKIRAVGQNELKLFTNTNYCYNIKYIENENKVILEESPFIEIQNISSKYAPSFYMSNITMPIIIYQNNKYMIKGGFWDGRLEINSLINEPKEKPISYSIFIKEGPVTVMQMTKDEKTLLSETKTGYILFFSVNEQFLKINHIIYTYCDELVSISVNESLNIFAASSIDGYVMIYLLPSFKLIRSIKTFSSDNNYSGDGEIAYANNVFLSSSPLPCISLFIGDKRIFRTYTINGELIGENQENTSNIKCSIIVKNLYFEEFLIYGTDDGFVKIRSFPHMDLINNIKPCECNEIISMEISQDKRYCYIYIKDNKIHIIKDFSVSNNDKNNSK